jgi:hypothetical protein
MRKFILIGATAIGAAVLCASPISIDWSANKTLSVSQDQASAEVGRPLTAGSVAGVKRRHDRRATDAVSLRQGASAASSSAHNACAAELTTLSIGDGMQG